MGSPLFLIVFRLLIIVLATIIETHLPYLLLIRIHQEALVRICFLILGGVTVMFVEHR